MRNQLDDCQRAKHILDSIQEIEAYVASIDFDNFRSNSLVRSATERQLTIIGEAVNALTNTIRNKIYNHRLARYKRVSEYNNP